jgi:hypothetical protein
MILFSVPSLGESNPPGMRGDHRARPNDFSFSVENTQFWLTGKNSRFTLFELFAYVYSRE